MRINSSELKDIKALKGIPLKRLSLIKSDVSDLESLISVLEGMPLEYLNLNRVMSDINALKGMPLKFLYLRGTKVVDISVLKGMSLRFISLPSTAKNIEFLKLFKNLYSINCKNAKDFWKEYDAKKSKKQ